MCPSYGFSPKELRTLFSLDSPKKIQRYLHKIGYNLEESGETCSSPRRVLREKEANCIEAAIFAAAALRLHGYPPLIVDLTSVRDDDHVIAVFNRFGHWGSIAKSKYTGLRYREPIYRTIRDLVLSYFEDYFNFRGEKTLRGYSRAVNLSRFDKVKWMTTEENLFCISDYLNDIPHSALITRGMANNLSTVTSISKEAGELWMMRTGILRKLRPKRGRRNAALYHRA